MDPRNFTYMFYGFLVTWLLLFVYVAWLVLRAGVGLLASRERKLRRELDRLTLLLGEKR